MFAARHALDHEQLQFAEAIRGSADTLLVLINDISDFSKVEAGEVELDMIDFELPNLIEGISQIMTFAAEKKNLSLIYFIQLGLEPNVLEGDCSRIRQILLNLINNSIKFTNHSAVHLMIKIVQRADRKKYIDF